MAGIGFELRTLFKGKGLAAKSVAVLTSVAVTVGPGLVCIGAIAAMQSLLAPSGEGTGAAAKRIAVGTHAAVGNADWLAMITIAFCLSLILTGAIVLTASRHASDLLHARRYEALSPSLYGFLLTALVPTGLVGAVVCFRLPAAGFDRWAMWQLLMLLSAIWVEMVFLTALRDVTYLTAVFCCGLVAGVCFGAVHARLRGGLDGRTFLISFVCAFTLILTAYHAKLVHVLGIRGFRWREAFAWIDGLDRFPQIPLIGLLHYLLLFSHSIVMWLSPAGTSLPGGLRAAPGYDASAFQASLTIYPAMVWLVVRMETTLAVRIHHYESMASGRGSIGDVKKAAGRLAETIEWELKLFLRLQTLVTTGCMLAAVLAKSASNGSMESAFTLCALMLGNFAFVALYAVCLVMLYLDDRWGVLASLGAACALSFALTGASVLLGPAFYGTGFAMACMLALAGALMRLSDYLKELNLRIFLSQPLHPEQEMQFFKRLRGRLTKGD